MTAPNETASELLIGAGSPHLSSWLADETLFGLCSRHHYMSGNPLDWQTSVQLFGVRNGAAWDFPRRLNAFVQVTGGVLGNPEEIARTRTVLGFYLPFRERKVQSDLLAAVAATSLGSAKGKLGLMASRFGASHPLKACRSCMVRDKADQDVASWRLEHQLPGYWLCAEHLEPLVGTTIKASGAALSSWMLPGQVQLRDFVGQRVTDPRGERLKDVAHICAAISLLPREFHFEYGRLVSTYTRRLQEMGLETNGRLRRTAFQDYANEKLGKYRAVPEFRTLLETSENLGSGLLGILRQDRPVHHPLRHVAIILVLYGSWTAFMCAYKSPLDRSRHEKAVEAAASPGNRCGARDRLVSAVRAGLSPTAAAKKFDVSVVTSIAWCATEGIAAEKRPSKFSQEKQARAAKILRRGGTAREAAQATGVSVASIASLLKTSPQLQAARTALKRDLAREKRRKAWNAAVRGLGRCTPADVRRRVPTVFSWLYRYDRRWLEDASGGLNRRPAIVARRVDWGKRDAALATMVRNVALGLSRSGKRVRRASLCECIPELKSRLSSPTLLPLTRTAVAEVTRPRRKKDGTLSLVGCS